MASVYCVVVVTMREGSEKLGNWTKRWSSFLMCIGHDIGRLFIFFIFFYVAVVTTYFARAVGSLLQTGAVYLLQNLSANPRQKGFPARLLTSLALAQTARAAAGRERRKKKKMCLCVRLKDSPRRGRRKTAGAVTSTACPSLYIYI